MAILALEVALASVLESELALTSVVSLASLAAMGSAVASTFVAVTASVLTLTSKLVALASKGALASGLKLTSGRGIGFRDCFCIGLFGAIGFLSKYLFVYLLASIFLLQNYFKVTSTCTASLLQT